VAELFSEGELLPVETLGISKAGSYTDDFLPPVGPAVDSAM
jgi:hypothetical protein